MTYRSAPNKRNIFPKRHGIFINHKLKYWMGGRLLGATRYAMYVLPRIRWGQIIVNLEIHIKFLRYLVIINENRTCILAFLVHSLHVWDIKTETGVTL